MDTPLSNLRSDILSCIHVGSVAALQGPPGCGKTAMVGDIAREIGGAYVTIIGSQSESTDINGFPTIVPGSFEKDADGREHPVLRFAPRAAFVELHRRGGLLFFDEITSAPASTQAAMLRGLNDWVFGDFVLDRSRVGIVIAYNPADIAVNGQELADPVNNRIATFTYPTGSDAVHEWCNNFPSYWGFSPRVGFGNRFISEDVLLRARSFVAGYIRANPGRWLDERFKMGDNETGKSKNRRGAVEQTSPAFCTPRSWHRASNHVAMCIADGLPPMAALRRVSAEIGSPAALEFQVYLREAALPDPEALLAAPEKYRPSGRLDIDFATMLAVVSAFEANATGDRYLAAWKILAAAVSDKGGNTPAYESGMAAALRLSPYMDARNQDKLAKLQAGLDKSQFGILVKECYKISKPFAKIIDKINLVAA